MELGEPVEADQLRPDEHSRDREQERRGIEPHGAEDERARNERERQAAADAREADAGVKEQPVRREGEEQLQVAPAVAPAVEVRRPRAPVGFQCRRHLGDPEAGERRLDDHLGGELHAGRGEPQVEDRGAPEASQPAVEVADRAAEEQPAHEGQHRVAEVPVEPWHRLISNAALEAVAHDEVRALAKLRDEAVELCEVIGVVAVTHDHIAAARRGDAGAERGAVAARRDLDDARPERPRDVAARIRRAVVGDDHLAGNP